MKRILYFDNIKGILILFVILGHTLTLCANYYDFNHSLFKLITFFMMPAFLFVTGYFASKSHKPPIVRASKMFIIFIFTQTIITLYYTYVLGIISFDKNPLIPRYTLWFLLTCGFLYLSEYLIKKMNFKPIFITSLIIALISGFFSEINNFLSLSRTITSFPMFILGYKASEINLKAYINKYRKPAFILTIIITILFLFNMDFFLFKDIYLKYSYYIYDNPLEGFIKRLLIYLISAVFTISFLNIISKNKTLFTTLGTQTLIIYLTHGVILKTLITLNLMPENAIIGTILTYIIVLSSSTIIAFTINKIKKIGGTINAKDIFNKPETIS